MRISVVLDCLDADRLGRFWSAALDYRRVDSPPGYQVLVPELDESSGPVLILQQVEEPKQGKNRMHLDAHPPLSIGVDAMVDRLEKLGGRRISGPVTELVDSAGVWWQVMADPEGNEFCIVADSGHAVPAT